MSTKLDKELDFLVYFLHFFVAIDIFFGERVYFAKILFVKNI